MERRFVKQARVGIERRAGGKRSIVGYGAVFYNPNDPGTQYDLFAGIILERVAPTAFNRAQSERHDVRGLVNHDPNIVLGRTAAGTMALSVDQRGLLYDIPIEEGHHEHERYATVIARGDMSGSSFGFRVTAEEWHSEGRNDIRTITDLDLYDVSPVTFPAYEGTSTALRGVQYAVDGGDANYSAAANALAMSLAHHTKVLRSISETRHNIPRGNREALRRSALATMQHPRIEQSRNVLLRAIDKFNLRCRLDGRSGAQVRVA